jgi:hypothetical protein
MTKEERLEKVTKDFSKLPDEKKEFILGVLQALVFANTENQKPVLSDSERNTEINTDLTKRGK